LKDHYALIIRIKQLTIQMKALQSFEMYGTASLTTQHHIPEDTDHHVCRHKFVNKSFFLFDECKQFITTSLYKTQTKWCNLPAGPMTIQTSICFQQPPVPSKLISSSGDADVNVTQYCE